jgi:hypothetical protein
MSHEELTHQKLPVTNCPSCCVCYAKYRPDQHHECTEEVRTFVKGLLSEKDSNDYINNWQKTLRERDDDMVAAFGEMYVFKSDIASLCPSKWMTATPVTIGIMMVTDSHPNVKIEVIGPEPMVTYRLTSHVKPADLASMAGNLFTSEQKNRHRGDRT